MVDFNATEDELPSSDKSVNIESVAYSHGVPLSTGNRPRLMHPLIFVKDAGAGHGNALVLRGGREEEESNHEGTKEIQRLGPSRGRASSLCLCGDNVFVRSSDREPAPGDEAIRPNAAFLDECGLVSYYCTFSRLTTSRNVRLASVACP